MNLKRSSKQANPINVVNHELKSRLFSIKVYTQLLEKNILKINNQKLLAYAEKVDTQIDKLSYALSDFIDYIKITDKTYALNQEFLFIDDVIAQTVKIFLSLYPKAKIKVVGKTTREIFADRNKLDKVLYTLLINACIYTVKTPKIKIHLSQLAKGIEVTVEDNGIGIKKTFMAKIFDPFYSIPLDGHKQRAGLGLFVAKEIIDRHGGKIRTTSTTPKGSTFTFSLPF